MSTQSAPGSALLGRVLDDRFALKAVLGAGGMGTVYRAEQFSMQRDVAVKVLRADANQDEQAIRRFLTEARAASRLKSPHTVTVHDFGRTADGLLYIAMELMDGQTLAQALKAEGRPIGLVRATRLLNQVLDSIEEAHGVGILHRDLKPENVFLLETVGSRDFVKVLDFGVARMVGEGRSGTTLDGLSIGTPEYMSPEQMMGEEVGPATDLYALATMLFEMLAGRPPLDGIPPVEMALLKIEGRLPAIREVYPEAETADTLDAFLARALAPKASDRPFDVETFRAELNDVVRNATTGPRPDPSLRLAPPTPTAIGIPALEGPEPAASAGASGAIALPAEPVPEAAAPGAIALPAEPLAQAGAPDDLAAPEDTTLTPPPFVDDDEFTLDEGLPADPADPARSGVPWAIAAAKAVDRAMLEAAPPAGARKAVAAPEPTEDDAPALLAASLHDGPPSPASGPQFLKTVLHVPVAELLAQEGYAKYPTTAAEPRSEARPAEARPEEAGPSFVPGLPPETLEPEDPLEGATDTLPGVAPLEEPSPEDSPEATPGPAPRPEPAPAAPAPPAPPAPPAFVEPAPPAEVRTPTPVEPIAATGDRADAPAGPAEAVVRQSPHPITAVAAMYGRARAHAEAAGNPASAPPAEPEAGRSMTPVEPVAAMPGPSQAPVEPVVVRPIQPQPEEPILPPLPVAPVPEPEPAPRSSARHRPPAPSPTGERRAYPRKPHLIAVICVKDGVRHPAYIADISEAGSFLNSAWMPNVGEEIILLFRPRTEDSGPAIVLMAEVVRLVNVPAGPGEVRGFSVRWNVVRTQGRLERLQEFYRHLFGTDLPSDDPPDAQARLWEYRFDQRQLIRDGAPPRPS